MGSVIISRRRTTFGNVSDLIVTRLSSCRSFALPYKPLTLETKQEMMKLPHSLATSLAFFFLLSNHLIAADHVVYEGDAGPGKGKHILFIASDHEYRGEETCPAIARILAKRYGFKCTVLFGVSKASVTIPIAQRSHGCCRPVPPQSPINRP